MNDNRLLALSTMLASYSQGNFDVEEVALSENLDEIDSIISGINMLGEELRETTISRDFFSRIYNAVTDMLFVVKENGKIADKNRTVEQTLSLEKFKHYLFQDLCYTEDEEQVMFLISKNLNSQNPTFKFESWFKNKENKKIFTLCTATKLQNTEENEFLIVAEDITLKKETENRILRTIIETQENERERVADDLHDSIGQELSSIKMMLGVAKNQSNEKNRTAILNSTLEILEGSIQDLRNICFNLMPSILEKGGLIMALEQLSEKINFNIHLESNVEEVALEKQAQVTIYRVIQEFINNSLKHSKAKKIEIAVNQTKENLEISIKDDGVGFDIKTLKTHDGRGLNTMKSRVESFGGRYDFSSKAGKGTVLKMTFA